MFLQCIWVFFREKETSQHAVGMATVPVWVQQTQEGRAGRQSLDCWHSWTDIAHTQLNLPNFRYTHTQVNTNTRAKKEFPTRLGHLTMPPVRVSTNTNSYLTFSHMTQRPTSIPSHTIDKLWNVTVKHKLIKV